MKRIVIINGPAGSGKDTLIELCRQFLAQSNIPVHSFSSVDEIKQLALHFGWDGVKDERCRALLSNLKLSHVAYNDGPTLYLERMIHATEDGLIFLHIREPEEIAKIVARFPEARTLHLERFGIAEYANVSDAGTRNYLYDLYLDNNQGLDYLAEIARQLVLKLYADTREDTETRLELK